MTEQGTNSIIVLRIIISKRSDMNIHSYSAKPMPSWKSFNQIWKTWISMGNMAKAELKSIISYQINWEIDDKRESKRERGDEEKIYIYWED